MRKLSIMLVLVLLVMLVSPLAEYDIYAASKVKLSKKNITLEVGDTAILSVSGTTKKVKWSSKDKSVVTVTNGVIRALAEGKTTITVKVKGKKLKCGVTVNNSECIFPVSTFKTDAEFYSAVNKMIKGR